MLELMGMIYRSVILNAAEGVHRGLRQKMFVSSVKQVLVTLRQDWLQDGVTEASQQWVDEKMKTLQKRQEV